MTLTSNGVSDLLQGTIVILLSVTFLPELTAVETDRRTDTEQCLMSSPLWQSIIVLVSIFNKSQDLYIELMFQLKTSSFIAAGRQLTGRCMVANCCWHINFVQCC